MLRWKPLCNRFVHQQTAAVCSSCLHGRHLAKPAQGDFWCSSLFMTDFTQRLPAATTLPTSSGNIYSSLATRHSQIDAIWSAGFCDWGNWGTVLAKAAIDCFVSLFCSSRPLTPHWSSMAVPPWEWFYWRSLPVQKAFFLPSVTKCLLTGDHLTFRVL